jgi:hypothetical protein
MKYFLIGAWLLILSSAGAKAKNLRVSLPVEVCVRTNTLRLSDLLPADAGSELQVAAESLFLGRAPQPGSLRVFSASGLRHAIGEAAPWASEIDIPAQVVVRRWGWSIEPDTVRRTLAQSKFAHQLDFSQARITLPAGISTALPHPQFEVTAFKPGEGDRAWLARIRCRDRAECGSFLTQIAVSGAVSVVGSPPVPVAATYSPRGLKGMSKSGPVLIQPGRMAVLVIDGNGFRITQPVMPLRGARLGELVRVTDPLTHRSLVARVSGKGMLRPDAITKEEDK